MAESKLQQKPPNPQGTTGHIRSTDLTSLCCLYSCLPNSSVRCLRSSQQALFFMGLGRKPISLSLLSLESKDPEPRLERVHLPPPPLYPPPCTTAPLTSHPHSPSCQPSTALCPLHWAPRGLPQGDLWSPLSGHGLDPSGWPGFEYSKQSMDDATSFPCGNVWEAQ